jgi:hypothetical protein
MRCAFSRAGVIVRSTKLQFDEFASRAFSRMVNESFARAHWALVFLLLACGAPEPSQPAPAQPEANGGGLNLIPPPVNCPDLATLAPADAGACIVLKKRNFVQGVAPIFEGCGGEVCHFFGSGAIADQVGVLADECCNEIQIIEPGHPERSYLVDKLQGRNLCMGSRMPLNQPPLSPDDMQAVVDWICQGAGRTP